MSTFPTRLLLTLFGFGAAALGAIADTGTPHKAGTRVEVATPSGTVAGTLQESTATGWILVQEAGRPTATAIPDRSVGFIRVTDAAVAGPTPAPAGPTFPLVAPPGSAELAPAAAGHVLHGRPRVTLPERFRFAPDAGGPVVPGVTELERFAFTLGHYDKFKTPAWVAMKWTKKELNLSKAEPSHPRPFRADSELPDYAQTGKDYQHDIFKYQRGHMARHEDLSGFHDGRNKKRGSSEGCLMSNIVPQKQAGHNVWGKLENEHRNIVGGSAGIGPIWVISGPVFRNGQAVELIGPDQVGAPHDVYKIIAWRTPAGKLTARGYVIGQNATDFDLKGYLTKIDDIEAATGLNFFPDLPAAEQTALEAKTFTTLWGAN